MKQWPTLVLLTLLNVQQIPADGGSALFVPYHGKEVRVGMSVGDLGIPEQTTQRIDDVYGKPIVRRSFAGGLVVESLLERPEVFFRIILTTPELALSNGVRVGISGEDLTAKLGKPAGSGMFKGRRWAAYDYAKESGQVVLILNAYFNEAGNVEELRLVVPG